MTSIDHPADLGQLIRHTRIRHGHSQLALARQLNCSTRWLADLEVGLLAICPIATLEQIRELLQLDPLEVDATTGALWRDPPRLPISRTSCGLLLTRSTTCEQPH